MLSLAHPIWSLLLSRIPFGQKPGSLAEVLGTAPASSAPLPPSVHNKRPFLWAPKASRSGLFHPVIPIPGSGSTCRQSLVPREFSHHVNFQSKMPESSNTLHHAESIRCITPRSNICHGTERSASLIMPMKKNTGGTSAIPLNGGKENKGDDIRMRIIVLAIEGARYSERKYSQMLT